MAVEIKSVSPVPPPLPAMCMYTCLCVLVCARACACVCVGTEVPNWGRPRNSRCKRMAHEYEKIHWQKRNTEL